jgi:hypothetical protein
VNVGSIRGVTDSARIVKRNSIAGVSGKSKKDSGDFDGELEIARDESESLPEAETAEY